MAWTKTRITSLTNANWTPHGGAVAYVDGAVEATVDYDETMVSSQTDGALGPTAVDITSHAVRGTIVCEHDQPWTQFLTGAAGVLVLNGKSASTPISLTIGLVAKSSGVVFTGCNVGPLESHPAGGPAMRSTLTFEGVLGSADTILTHMLIVA